MSGGGGSVGIGGSGWSGDGGGSSSAGGAAGAAAEIDIEDTPLVGETAAEDCADAGGEGEGGDAVASPVAAHGFDCGAGEGISVGEGASEDGLHGGAVADLHDPGDGSGESEEDAVNDTAAADVAESGDVEGPAATPDCASLGALEQGSPGESMEAVQYRPYVSMVSRLAWRDNSPG